MITPNPEHSPPPMKPFWPQTSVPGCSTDHIAAAPVLLWSDVYSGFELVGIRCSALRVHAARLYRANMSFTPPPPFLK